MATQTSAALRRSPVEARSSDARRLPLAHGPAGRIFLVVLAVGGLIWLWAAFYPGEPLAWYLLAFVVVPVVSLFWIALLIRSVALRKVQLSLVVSLAVFLLMGILAVGHLPLKARFALNRVAFDGVVASAGEPTVAQVKSTPSRKELEAMWSSFPGECPSALGSFTISRCTTFPAGYLFFETSGAMFQNAGFAYLPDGVPKMDISRETFVSPDFVHLRGSWFAFTSTW